MPGQKKDPPEADLNQGGSKLSGVMLDQPLHKSTKEMPQVIDCKGFYVACSW
jgi:hypothetical protein